MSYNIWVVGSPRSGTSFLTDFIGNYTDYCFNEPWDEFPLGKHESWNLPEGSMVFKYCSNALYYQSISDLYPNSKWVHIVRNPFHVLYSMNFTKEDAWPKRTLEKFGKADRRLNNAFYNWSLLFGAAKSIEKAMLVKYEDVDVDGLAKFLNLPLSQDSFDFENRNKLFDPAKMEFLIESLKRNGIYKYVEERAAIKLL